MKVEAWTSALKTAAMVSNPKGLTLLYQSVELGGETVRACCSEIGSISIVLDEHTGLRQPCLVNLENLRTVLQSLNPSEELHLAQGSSALHWQSDYAQDSIQIEQQQHEFPDLLHSNYPWQPPDCLADALLLAATAVSAATVSTSMFGVEIQPQGQLLRLGSSSEAISIASLRNDGYPISKRICIRPYVVKALGYLLQNCSGCMLDITDKGIFLQGDWVTAEFRLAPLLAGDVFARADQYQNQKCTVDFDFQRLKRFVSPKLLKPILGKVSTVVLDHLWTDGVLVFREDSPDLTFEYFVGV